MEALWLPLEIPIPFGGGSTQTPGLTGQEGPTNKKPCSSNETGRFKNSGTLPHWHLSFPWPFPALCRGYGCVPGSWLLMDLLVSRGESHITRDFVPDCSQDTDQDLSPSGGYGRCLNTTHTSAYRPAASGHTTVALETHMYQEHGWTLNSLQWWALYQKSYFQCTDCLTLCPSSPPVHLTLEGSLVTEGSCPQKGISSFLHHDQDKSDGGLMVLERPVLKIQDSLLPALGDDACSFPYQSGGQSLQRA